MDQAENVSEAEGLASSTKDAEKEAGKEAHNLPSVAADMPSDVAFLYKTMIQRDPSKRRVKPVESNLIQIHFGMSEDEEDDSDYEFKPPAEESDEDDIDDEEELGSDGEGEVNSLIVKDVADVAKTTKPTMKSAKMRVCSVCLGLTSEEDEIIECDSCGILVHEGCYGVVDDALSSTSSQSSESTEPWFCDSCKAGGNPSCELCPNTFGIFKQTDTGRWVHLICALYVPGVAFGNTERLTNVTLLEMPYSKWGSKECSLCEDVQYSHTGVCIGCDAGMCRTYFHVTCAQREGLLSEASLDEDIADPFYAHCKMHGDKHVTKQKKRHFIMLYSHVNQFREEKKLKQISERTKRKLKVYVSKFLEAESRRAPAWVPPTKLPRAITSSASAVRSLLKKAELLKMHCSEPEFVQQKTEVPTKKSYIAPALSVEFAAYYHHRDQKIASLKQHTDEMQRQNHHLQEQEADMRRHLDKLKTSIKDLSDSTVLSKSAGLALWTALEKMTNKKITIPSFLGSRPVESNPSESSDQKSKAVLQYCGVCHKANDQHLLARCDTCQTHYHLSCLDPPLLRMPKKSRLCGWICSKCDLQHEKAAPKELPVDMEAPRRLRETIKEPVKFMPPEMQLFVEKSRGMNIRRHSQLRNRGRPPKSKRELSRADNAASKAKQPNPSDADDKLSISSVVSAESPQSPASLKKGRKRKAAAQETGQCCTCKAESLSESSVRCDNCKSWFHFSCLNPPVKKSPKVRGYSWHCETCDPADGDLKKSTEADDSEHAQSMETPSKEETNTEKVTSGNFKSSMNQSNKEKKVEGEASSEKISTDQSANKKTTKLSTASIN